VQRIALGTLVEIVARDPDPERGRRAIEDGFAEIERLEALISEWRPTSEISRLNAAAGGAAVAVSEETAAVLVRSAEITRDTGGTFDPTVLPLVRAWGFAGGEPRIPSDAEIEAARRLVGIDALEVDAASGRARLVRPGVAIGLGAIGKGFVADRVAARLKAAGVPAAMVKASGDFACYGGSAKRPWPVAIEDPDRPGETLAEFEIVAGGVSTSAPTYRHGEQDGVRFHHLIDPHTGRSARGARSVTIVADDDTLADAYATGVFVMGAAGPDFVQARPWLRTAIVLEDGRRFASPGLEIRWLPR
jgi:thiamine biosynthesis lipoprotein